MNTSTKVFTFFGAFMALMMIFAMALWVVSLTQKAAGSAPTGMKTVIASSTVKATVSSTTPVVIFDASPDCTARVITTFSQPILITFATSTDLDQTVRPTATFGHIQAASTTVVYDAGTYGCDVWQAYGYEFSVTGASTTITLSEFKGFR